MKRIIALATSCVLIFSLLLPFSETTALAKDSESELTLLKNTKEHKIFELQDGETLEQFNKDGEEYFVANAGEESFKIIKENNVVSVINLQSNEIVETYTSEEVNKESGTLTPVNPTDLSVIDEGSEIGTYAQVTPGPGSKYKYVRTRNMSMEIVSTTASIIAGVIASFIGTPVTGAIVSVATGVASLKLKRLYWKEALYQYKESVYLYKMWSNTFYKYHDYTGYLGAEVKFTKSRVM